MRFICLSLVLFFLTNCESSGSTAAPTITVVNPITGSSSGATSVVITGTGLSGATSLTFDGVAATNLNVVNSTTIIAVVPGHTSGVVDVAVTTPNGSTTKTNAYTYLATAIGQESGGGIIACLDGGTGDLIAGTADENTSIVWGSLASTSATSLTDGATNTATIVTSYGAGTYAAQACDDYEVDSAGNTPCESGYACYSDWFLPAKNQLDCLYTNKTAVGAFSAANYWSSTENDATTSWAQDFTAGAQALSTKTTASRARCVRNFTPVYCLTCVN